MKTEDQIRDKIDQLNHTWNETFIKSKNPDNAKYLDKFQSKCKQCMDEIVMLKWVLGEHYILPKHSLSFDYLTGDYKNG